MILEEKMEIVGELEEGNHPNGGRKKKRKGRKRGGGGGDCSEAFNAPDTSLLCLQSQGTDPHHLCCKETVRCCN